MKKFILHSDYQPMGDQPDAIQQLTQCAKEGAPAQVLLGVTGSGKTFTVANVIKNLNKPTLVLSHNKTLAAQLYTEFKGFFPENAVEYYVSYYDYYQPEAYIAATDTYIEKDLAINEDIDKLRLSAISALLSGRQDVVVVSSVSCIYGMGNPSAFYENLVELKVGRTISIKKLLNKLVDCLYTRNDVAPRVGNFRVKGDTVDVFLAYADEIIRISFWDDEIDGIEEIDAITGMRLNTYDEYKIYPANLFLTSKDTQEIAIRHIQDDLVNQVRYFNEIGKELEAKRLKERVEYDIEMIRELGHCAGIENYSRYFDGREPGTRPFCLLDFFPDNFLLVIDESHVTIPQIRAMYGGDKSRKEALVNYGFRLPAAMDNRPLKFDEFYDIARQVIYISATPAEYELTESEGIVVDQVIRPTGLLDPIIEVRDTDYPVDDLMEEIRKAIAQNERILVTTLTKRMAEELTDYLLKNNVNTAYIHSDVDTLERVQIMEDLRRGIYDVLVGVNLLREGLDLPEVALVAILDADKEGFLRSTRSLTQTAGRAARNVNGRVIMYAKQITKSMQQTIDETERRRIKQIAYNKEHHLRPRPIVKAIESNELTVNRKTLDSKDVYIERMKQHIKKTAEYRETDAPSTLVAETVKAYNQFNQGKCSMTIEERIDLLKKQMKKAASEFDFILAAQLRDEILKMEEKINK